MKRPEKILGSLRDAAQRVGEGAWNAVPELPKLELAKTVEIPVYIVHNSPEPEDYFFLLDFEGFMAESQRGLFVRPALKLWAGRSDFARRRFARQLRAAFGEEFERMTRAKRAELEGRRFGWLGGIGPFDLVSLVSAGLLQTLMLFLAVTGGRAAWAEVRRMLGLASRKEAELGKLRAAVEEKKAVIDEALTRIEIVLHRDLYVHAWAGQPPGPLRDMDYEAWPLPEFVTEHLGDGVSRGWW